MNILLINGSPHKDGTSSLLMKHFIEGASTKGHEISIYDAASESVHPCIACEKCRIKADGCIFKDGMETLNPLLLSADLVVFVTPLYYFGMSSQIKAVIDRFYANNTALRSLPMKAAVLATCGYKDDWAFDALKNHLDTVCRYLNWEPAGSVYAKGVYIRTDIENSPFLQDAYKLGCSI